MLVGDPGIRRHVGEHRRSAEKAGIGRGKQQASLQCKNEPERAAFERGILPAEAFDDGLKTLLR